MKKLLLTIISITIALFTLAGCTVQENPNSMQDNSNANNNSIVQDNQSNNETTKTEVITLTKENFEQYFNVNAYTSDFYETKSYVFGM